MYKLLLSATMVLATQLTYAQGVPEIARPAAPEIQTPSAPFNGTMADSTAMPPKAAVKGVKLTPTTQADVKKCLETAKTADEIKACKQPTPGK